MNHPVEPTPSTPDNNLANQTLALPADWNYEQAVAQVEVIINRIEVGELELAEIFDQFAIAVEQLRQCETFLDQQKNQMDLLIETLVDGGKEEG